jgi:hypothetical protein
MPVTLWQCYHHDSDFAAHGMLPVMVQALSGSAPQKMTSQAVHA